MRPDTHTKDQHVLVLLPDDQVRFVGLTETIDVTQTNRFQIWTTREIECLLGHPVAFDHDRRPVLIGDNEHNTIKASAMIKDNILSNPKLSRKDKYRALKKIELGLRQQMAASKANVVKIEADLDVVARKKDMLIDIGMWLQKPMVLGRPDGSQLDAMQAAALERHVYVLPSDEAILPDLGNALDNVQSFVVAHNWAGAISEADIVGDGAGELAMPFPGTCFEFVVTGKRVMVVVSQDPEGVRDTRAAVIARSCDRWGVLMTYTIDDAWRAVPLIQTDPTGKRSFPPRVASAFQTLADLLIKNVWAIGVMLEAELVERQVVRIDAALNRARERRSKPPLHDYHVVSIRRDRVTPRTPAEIDPDRGITRKRWHLVRSHWRRYSDHRTKIPWHSRGDWDLGVIDKHYKL